MKWGPDVGPTQILNEKSLILMTHKVNKIRLCKWCQERDSNPRPPAYETSALTS